MCGGKLRRIRQVTSCLQLQQSSVVFVLQVRNEFHHLPDCFSSNSLIFGAITVVTGILGVASGVQVSRKLRTRTPRADPLVCAAGLLLSAPFLYLAIVFAQASTIATYVSSSSEYLNLNC